MRVLRWLIYWDLSVSALHIWSLTYSSKQVWEESSGRVSIKALASKIAQTLKTLSVESIKSIIKPEEYGTIGILPKGGHPPKVSGSAKRILPKSKKAKSNSEGAGKILSSYWRGSLQKIHKQDTP